MSRRLRLSLKRDEGLSMTELLVSIVVTSIIVVVAGTFFVQVTRTATVSNQTQISTRVGSTAISEMTNVIRMAASVTTPSTTPPMTVTVVEAKPNSITLNANVDTSSLAPAPTRVKFTLDSTGKLVETRYQAVANGTTWTFSSTASSTLTLATGLQQSAPSGEPVFQYFDHAADPTNPTAAYTPLSTATGLVVDPTVIRAIRVTVSSLAPTTTTTSVAPTPVVAQNTVVLRNLALGN